MFEKRFKFTREELREAFLKWELDARCHKTQPVEICRAREVHEEADNLTKAFLHYLGE